MPCVIATCVAEAVTSGCCPVHTPEAIVERVRTNLLMAFGAALLDVQDRPRAVARLLTLREKLLTDLANTL